MNKLVSFFACHDEGYARFIKVTAYYTLFLGLLLLLVTMSGFQWLSNLEIKEMDKFRDGPAQK